MFSLYLSPVVTEKEVGEKVTVSESIYREGGSPLVGELVEEQVYRFFVESAERRESVKVALRLLGYSDKSEKQMREHLLRRGFSPEVAREATEEAVRLGYLNERRACENLVLHLVNQKHYGARRILPALVAKGYAMPLVREVIATLKETGEIDFNASFKALLLKKRVQDITDPEERREKIKKLAYQYGYK